MRRPSLAFINGVFNRPEVLASVAPGFQRLDFSELYSATDSFAFYEDGVLGLFTREDEGFEAHAVSLHTKPGKDAVSAAKRMLDRVFTVSGAPAIKARIPRENRASRVFCRATGFTPSGDCRDALGRECVMYTLERRAWEMLSAASLESVAEKRPLG